MLPCNETNRAGGSRHSENSMAPHAKLTPNERYVLEELTTAFNRFVDLPDYHPVDAQEFANSINRAQAVIATRVARRANPEVWAAPLLRQEETNQQWGMPCVDGVQRKP